MPKCCGSKRSRDPEKNKEALKKTNAYLTKQITMLEARKIRIVDYHSDLLAHYRDIQDGIEILREAGIENELVQARIEYNNFEQECIMLAEKIKEEEKEVKEAEIALAIAKNIRAEITQTLASTLEFGASMMKEVADAKQHIETIEDESLCRVCFDTITDTVICKCGEGKLVVCIDCCKKVGTLCPFCREPLDMNVIESVTMWV